MESLPRRGPTYLAGLTSRETEVLKLVVMGKSNKEIAEELVISIRTVERHIANVYQKIGARGRIEATMFAIDNQLFSEESTPKRKR